MVRTRRSSVYAGSLAAPLRSASARATERRASPMASRDHPRARPAMDFCFHGGVPLSRLRLGDADAGDYAPQRLPLEPVVEAERVRGITGGHRRLAVHVG